MDCVFCRIAAGEVPADLTYQDDQVIAFPDINPAAPVHLLIVPRRHIESAAHLAERDTSLVARMIAVASRLAEKKNIARSGYRLVINTGGDGGQGVPHLHLHLLGGRQMSSDMG